MASTTAVCNSFKQQLLEALHDFNTGAHAFYWSLYTSSATHGAGTTVYSTTNELTTANGYTQGGKTYANAEPTLDSATAIVDWDDPTWTSASFTAASVLLWNTTHASDAAVAVWDFAGDKTASGGDFVLQLPAAAAATAILRLA
jgi:hypothetical protein